MIDRRRHFGVFQAIAVDEWPDVNWTPTEAAILGYFLALSPSFLDRRPLAVALYGDSSESALHAIRTAVTRIRAKLPAGWLIESRYKHRLYDEYWYRGGAYTVPVSRLILIEP